MNRQLTTHLAVLLVLPLGSTLSAATAATQDVWLGVQLAPVPEMLDVHLRTEGRGAMVRNIYVDSPADRAGLDRYDVIIEVDDQEVTQGVEGFSRYVRQRQAGDTLNLTLIRQGQRHTLSVALEPRGRDWSALEMKYPDDPDLSQLRDFDFRGHILKPGPEGWTWHDLGELPDVFGFLIDPERDDAADEPPAGKLEHFEARRVDEDGNILHVERRNNGTIVVTRMKEGQITEQAEVSTYLSVEELKANDPEAAELLDKLKPRKGRPNVVITPDSRRRLRPYAPAPELEEWRRQFRRFLPGPPQQIPGPRSPVAPHLRVPPRTTFDVKPDGSIEVHIRSGNSEWRRTFRSVEELRNEAPTLYREYQRLQGHWR